MERTLHLQKLQEARQSVRTVVCEEQSITQEKYEASLEFINTACTEAAKHGFSKADVIRALCKPVLEKREPCPCPGCRARRGELNTAPT